MMSRLIVVRTSGSLLSNNTHIHIVKHALWKSSVHEACQLVQVFIYLNALTYRWKSVYQLFQIAVRIQTLQADQIKGRQQAKTPKKHRFDYINFVDLITEELPTIPQVVVIDLTIDPC
jgi:hypothetical protein